MISGLTLLGQIRVSDGPGPHEYRVTPLILRGHITEMLQWLIRRFLGEALLSELLSLSLGAHHCTRLNLFPELIITQTESPIYGINLKLSKDMIRI